MNGNYNQYDPSKMFREWIGKNGHAQAEFMKNFGSLMANSTGNAFNPLETLKTISENTRNAQSKMIEDASAIQNRGIDTLFGMGQMLPAFMNWGAYKTVIGSNGRISIPEAERSALGLSEGDLVQVVILPIAKKSKEVKQ